MVEEENISQSQINKAVTALHKHLESQKTKKKANGDDLLDASRDYYWLVLATKKISGKTKVTPHRIPLKHSLCAEDQQICLITKDPQSEYKDLLRSQRLMDSTVHKVIGVTKLRQKYKPHEAKRLLCQSYDTFLADERVITLLPKLIGKNFYARKKIPIPVNLTRKDLAKELNFALNSTYLFVSNGCTSCVRIGFDGQTIDQVCENIATALPALMAKISKGWANIQSIHLKTNQSVALPLYNSLPSAPAVNKDDGSEKQANEAEKLGEAEKETKEDRKRRLAAEGKLPDLAFRDVCKRIKLKV